MKLADHLRLIGLDNVLKHRSMSKKVNKFYMKINSVGQFKKNFGIYFQLNGGKAVPFDHIQNRELNARGTRFEVIYRSYYPIEGGSVELVARQHGSTYYKIYQGQRTAWLNCKEG